MQVAHGWYESRMTFSRQCVLQIGYGMDELHVRTRVRSLEIRLF
jgi:hypothetical protein